MFVWFALVTATCGTIISTEFNPGELGRFYVEMTFENGTVLDYPAVLDLRVSSPVGYGSYNPVEGLKPSDLLRTSNYSFANGSIIVGHREEILNPKILDANPLFHVPAGPMSPLFGGFPTILFTPIARNRGMIVLDPEDPLEYAYERHMFHTNSISRHSWDIGVFFLITDERKNVALSRDEPKTLYPAACQLHSSAKLFVEVTAQVFKAFDDALTAVGGVTIAHRSWLNGHMTTIVRIDDEAAAFENLPHIRLLVKTHENGLSGFTIIEPTTYLLPSVQNPGHFLLLIRPHIIPVRCAIGPVILNDLVIHLDSRTGLIGFATPAQ